MIVEQPEYILNRGTKVKTHAELETTTGMMISYKYLVLRRTNDEGIIRGPVPGHGGDVCCLRTIIVFRGSLSQTHRINDGN